MRWIPRPVFGPDRAVIPWLPPQEGSGGLLLGNLTSHGGECRRSSDRSWSVVPGDDGVGEVRLQPVCIRESSRSARRVTSAE